MTYTEIASDWTFSKSCLWAWGTTCIWVLKKQASKRHFQMPFKSCIACTYSPGSCILAYIAERQLWGSLCWFRKSLILSVWRSSYSRWGLKKKNNSRISSCLCKSLTCFHPWIFGETFISRWRLQRETVRQMSKV